MAAAGVELPPPNESFGFGAAVTGSGFFSTGGIVAEEEEEGVDPKLKSAGAGAGVDFFSSFFS